jgi:hypothetical protein
MTQEFKIRIIDRTWEKLKKRIHQWIATTWTNMDGKKLEFQSPFRPRLKYLYYHYCLQILRHTYQQTRTSNGKVGYIVDVWPCTGNNINAAMLEEFAEKLGHLGADYSHLMKGACTHGEEQSLLENDNDSGSGSGSESEIETETDSDSESDVESKNESKGDTETETDSESESESDSNSDSESDSDGDWDWVHRYGFELYPVN